jgi:hypothetical protein
MIKCEIYWNQYRSSVCDTVKSQYDRLIKKADSGSQGNRVSFPKYSPIPTNILEASKRLSIPYNTKSKKKLNCEYWHYQLLQEFGQPAWL